MTAPTDPQIAAVVEGLSEAQRAALIAAPTWAGDEAHLPALRALGRKGLLGLCTITHKDESRKAAVLCTSGLAVRAHLERQDDEG